MPQCGIERFQSHANLNISREMQSPQEYTVATLGNIETQYRRFDFIVAI
jgi:hypothetical protein